MKSKLTSFDESNKMAHKSHSCQKAPVHLCKFLVRVFMESKACKLLQYCICDVTKSQLRTWFTYISKGQSDLDISGGF